jgi:uncharacterized membrane protein
MAGTFKSTRAHVARWVATGLIDADTAGRLHADLDRQKSHGIGFAGVFALMAAALFGASILIFIAANWEAMPRLWRVGMVFAVILAAYLAGAMFRLRGHDGFGEAAFVVGGAAFGAGIALIGQMYNMAGDERQAILVWFAGVLAAAAVLRSWPLNVGAALLCATWFGMGFEGARNSIADLPHAWLLLGAATWAVSLWTRSAMTRHILSLTVLAYLVSIYATDDFAAMGPIVAIAGMGLVLLGRMMPAEIRSRAGLGDPVFVHGFLYFLVGMAMVHAELDGEPAFLVAPIVTFLGIIAAVIVAGRESPGLRRLAYAAFAGELVYLYVDLIGSMMDTAGFFLLVGLVLAGLAWLATRIERRMAASAGEPAR